jgi:hypothetical protein
MAARKKASEAGKSAAETISAAAAAARSNPYVQRVIEDPDLRDNVRVAFDQARQAYQRLSNGKAPTKVPFSAQGRRFNLTELRAQTINGKWAVTEGGRHLFDVSGPEEGEQLIRLLRHFQFDQVCLLGQNPRAGLQFLAKGR